MSEKAGALLNRRENCWSVPATSEALRRWWIVERTLAWLVRHRRLAIDYEALPTTSEAFIYAAMVRVMVRQLAS